MERRGAELAAASQARKEAEALALSTENRELQSRIERTGARTDDSIDDDPAGIARKQLAAASLRTGGGDPGGGRGGGRHVDGDRP